MNAEIEEAQKLTKADAEQKMKDDEEELAQKKFRVESVCEVATISKNSAVTTAARTHLDQIILRGSRQGSLEKLIRTTALIMRFFQADLRIVNDSVDNCDNPSIRMLDNIDEVTASEYCDTS